MKLINQVSNTLSYGHTLGRVFMVFIVVAVLFTAFLLLSNGADAAYEAGEHTWFRIDSELDVLIANKGTLTLRWYCGGAATFGEVNDGTSSESTSSADGIVKVASNSKEMTDASCTIGASETLRASASIDGWVAREWTAASFPGASTSTPFTTRASLDYILSVSGAQDELSNAFTMASTSNATNTFASASYSVAPASSSYHLGVWYAAPTADGTLSGGKNGYVNKTSAVTWSSDYQTTSKSADFGTSTDSTYNGDALPFAHKISVVHEGSSTAVTVGTVTAGDSSATACTAGTGSNVGSWYCAIPLAETDTTATFVHDSWNTSTATYTDRSIGSAAQTTATIGTTPKSSGGGGGGGSTVTPTPTPAPTPTPEASVSPTPTPSATPTPTPVAGSVKLYRKVSDPKVYVQGADGLLTWVKTLEEFNAAGYKWSDVQVISGPEFAQLKIAPSSMPAMLFKKASDPKVYVQSEDGTLTWVKTLEEFNSAGYSWADVKIISGEEFGKMRVGGQIKVVQSIAFLRVRGGPSTSNAILGTVKPGQVLQFYEWKSGWYKIKRDDGTFGWVSGGYAEEI